MHANFPGDSSQQLDFGVNAAEATVHTINLLLLLLRRGSVHPSSGRPLMNGSSRRTRMSRLADALSAPAVRVALWIQWHASAAYPKPPGLARTQSKISTRFQNLRVYGRALA